MKRLLATLLLAAVAAPAALAHGGVIVERAVEALRTDPVYLHPDAIPTISEAEAAELRDRIDAAGGRIRVALLPADALHELETAEAVLESVARQAARAGTYAVVVGGQFRAGSTGGDLARGRAPAFAREAFREHSDEGLAPTLLAFVDRVGTERGEAAGEEEGGGSGVSLGVVGALVAGAIGFVFLRGRRRRARELAEVRETVEEDLVALGEDIRALDLDVELPGADARAKADYALALTAYERASRAFDRARRPEDMEAVSAALEEGRFAMTAAKARLAGEEPPERRPPCFFDPRHGPSTRDAEWAPPGGEPRPVPACEADAIRVEEGEEPESREVLVGGRRVPYWNASPAYGPWAGGFFGGAAGLVPALFVGSMIGTGFGLGFPGDADAGLGDDFSGGGDFGGGDFGGGDFGGGGDVGGGDF